MDNTIVEALNGVGTTLTTSISPATIAAIIGIVLGSGIALYLTWFGITKLIKVVTTALERGKIKVK